MALCALLIVGLVLSGQPAALARTAEKDSPPGQIVVVTLNARQRKVARPTRYQRLFDLARTLRSRPVAFDGGAGGGVAVADVIVLQEIRRANIDILRALVDSRFDGKYQMVMPEDPAPTIMGLLINTDTVSLAGEPETWPDPCIDGSGGSERRYLLTRFTEVESGAPFTIANLYIKPKYRSTGQTGCKDRNMDELRAQLDDEAGALIVAGDFNQRPVQMTYECDPDELSPSLSWYARLTEPSGGQRVYVDAARSHHRATRQSMGTQWTHEQKSIKVVCDNTARIRRSRIDYIFVSGATVAAASSDHPGWAAEEPGRRHPTNPFYSDHRFVWARLVLAGPSRPARPEVEQARSGVLNLSWEPSDAAGWVLYRARQGRPYAVLDRLKPTETTFSDSDTEHGQQYRYALAPVGVDGSQGLESWPVRAEADAVGPLVQSVTPGRDAAGVNRGTNLFVRFDDSVAAESVEADSIQVFAGGRRMRGRVVRERPRALKFNPSRRLRKRTTYRVVVRPVRDSLGNRGERFAWRFTTRRR